MNCDAAASDLVDRLEGNLPQPRAGELEEHLAGCPACRTEAQELERLWQLLGELPEEEPGPGLNERFSAVLAAYESGLEAGRSPQRRGRPPAALLQAAAVVATLGIGLAVGAGLGGGRGGSEIAGLRQEVASLNRAVTLSLLHDRSASERLKGVSLGSRLDADGKVLDALLAAATADPNANVRLAAVEALAPYAGSARVHDELLAALPREPSPLVQVELVDRVLASDGAAAREAVRRLLEASSVDPAVRRFIEDRLGQDT